MKLVTNAEIQRYLAAQDKHISEVAIGLYLNDVTRRCKYAAEIHEAIDVLTKEKKARLRAAHEARGRALGIY